MRKLSIRELSKKIINIGFITFLLLCFYLILSSKVSGIAPQVGGFQFISVLTGSMQPTIKPGSLIMIKEINDPSNLKVDDIITYQSPRLNNTLITHRIMEIKKVNTNIYYATKGDSNSTTDARRITTDDILGKYQRISIPYVGYLLEFTKTKLGFVIFFLIPIFLLLIPYLRYFWIPFTLKRSTSGGGLNENH